MHKGSLISYFTEEGELIMDSIILMGLLLVLFIMYRLRQQIIIIYKNASENIGAVGSWKRWGIFTWRIFVYGYALWLLWNFWKVIIFPNTPISIEQITNIIFHPPFIQLVLLLTFAWLIIALLNAPSMHLKGINTPFLRFEMDKVEEVVLQGAVDLEASRVSDESRWIAVRLATKVNPFNDVESEKGEHSDIELLAIAMGGIILDAFLTVNEDVEFDSGIVGIEEGGISDDIVYYPPDVQFIMRSAYREGNFYFKGKSLAVPIRYEDIEAIFYLYNSSINMYKMDCIMVETIWAILCKNVGKEN